MGFWVLLLWKRVPVREVFGRPPEALWCLILFIEHFVEPFICDRIFYKLKQTNKSSISIIVFNVFFKSKFGLITMRIQDLYLPLYIVWGEDENPEALLPFYTLTSMKVCCLYIKCVENKRKTQCGLTMIAWNKSFNTWKGKWIDFGIYASGSVSSFIVEYQLSLSILFLFLYGTETMTCQLKRKGSWVGF